MLSFYRIKTESRKRRCFLGVLNGNDDDKEKREMLLLPYIKTDYYYRLAMGREFNVWIFAQRKPPENGVTSRLSVREQRQRREQGIWFRV